jgi:vitamin B12 transporter
MTKLFFSILLVALGLATPAAAQSAPDEAAEQAASNVAGLVVTATRLPTEKLNVADSITVITAADIALKQQQTLPDILLDAPGLNVVQQGGPGGVTSVFMRGTDSNHVKVLMDGIDVSDPSSTNGTFDFGQFPAAGIERVEILRGPQSGLYGADAIGGVINIITKSGEGPPHVTLDVDGGSFATANEDGGVYGSTGPFHYAATIAHVDVGATPVTPLNLLAPGEARNDDGYENVTASTKLGYDVTSNFALGLVARYTSSHLFFTGDNDVFLGFPDPIQSQTDDRQYYLRGTGRLSLLSGRFDQALGVAYSNLQMVDTTPNFGSSLFFGNRWKVDWRGDIKLAESETLVIGAEDQLDAITRPIVARTNIASGYAELQSNPFAHFNGTISVRYDADSRFGDVVTYRFAPTYFIAATGTKLAASVGTGFKAPTLSEMFEDFPAFGFFGNPNLRPEKSTGYDIGFEEYLFSQRLQFGATYFYNHITDLITDNASFTSFANVGKAHTDGVESYVLVQPIRTLSFRADYTYTDSRDDILNEELIRRPRNKGSLDARWQATRKLALNADLLTVGSWVDGNRDFSVPRLLAPGYTTLDVAASYDLTRQLTLYGRVTNLFNKIYQDPDGFLKPGRGFFVGVRARL